MQRRTLLSLMVIVWLAGPSHAQVRTVLGAPTVQTPQPSMPPVVMLPAQTPPTQAPPAFNFPTDTPSSAEGIWVTGDVLLWSLKAANLPPLVTASPPGTPPANVGVLGVPDNVVLFGGSHVNGNITLGGRVTAGAWLDWDQTCGLEASYFQLASRTQHFSGGTPNNVGRPFTDASTGLPNAELVSFPGMLDGTVRTSAASGSFLGVGALARCNLSSGYGYRIDGLIGYRYLTMSDLVAVTENFTSTDPAQLAAPLGTNVVVADRFQTRNDFHGVDLGLASEYRRNAWTVGAMARVALGATYERAAISGATTVAVPGFAPVVSDGGLLALSSNSGIHTRDVFAIVPEVRLQLAYQLTERMRIHAGYSFLYWSQLARRGDQIDLALNPALLPPPVPGALPQRPAFQFHGTSFWAHGLNLGLELRF